MAGWFESLDQMRVHRAEALATASRVLDLPPGLAGKLYDELVPMYNTTGRFNPAAVNTLLKAGMDMGDLSSRSDPKKLIDDHFIPRYVEAGVNMSDLLGLRAVIERWSDWCRMWSETARMHEDLASRAQDSRRRVTVGQAFLRASICYHYAKHLFCIDTDQYEAAHTNMLRCHTSAGTLMMRPMERVEVSLSAAFAGWLAAQALECSARAGRRDIAGARCLQGGVA